MKFLISHDINKRPVFVYLLVFLHLGILAFLAIHLFLEWQTFGLVPTEILSRLLGSEALFLPPMEWETLILETHWRFFVYWVLFLVVFSVMVRWPKFRFKSLVMTTVFVASFLDILSLYVGRFWSVFIYLKPLFFFLWYSATLAVVVSNMVWLGRGRNDF